MIDVHSCMHAGTCRHVLAARADADAACRQLTLLERGRDLLAAILMENPLPEEIEHAEAKRRGPISRDEYGRPMDTMHVHGGKK